MAGVEGDWTRPKWFKDPVPTLRGRGRAGSHSLSWDEERRGRAGVAAGMADPMGP